MEGRAQRARPGSTRSQREQPNACHVCQARIQQSSGPQRHQHASIVFQTPARLKGAQSALVMRATRGLMEAHAQSARPGSTRSRQEVVIVASVRQTRARLRRAQLSRHASAMPAILEMLEAHARHVTQESIKARLDLAAATPARQTQTHLSLALRSQAALAMRAGQGQTEGHARRVWQESIKAWLELATANRARQTQTHRSLALRSQTAASATQAASVVMSAEVAQEAASATQGALRLNFVETGSSLQASVKYATMATRKMVMGAQHA